MEPCSTGSAPLPSRELALAALFLTFCAFEENLLELLGKRGVIEQARSCWCPEAGRSFEAYRLRPALRGVIPTRCTGPLPRRIYCGPRHAGGLLPRCPGGPKGVCPRGILIRRLERGGPPPTPHLPF